MIHLKAQCACRWLRPGLAQGIVAGSEEEHEGAQSNHERQVFGYTGKQPDPVKVLKPAPLGTALRGLPQTSRRNMPSMKRCAC